MTNKQFYEYVSMLLNEAGHMITSDPVYANHSASETLYIDSNKDVTISRFDRAQLLRVDNVSLLVELVWPGAVEDLTETVRIYSITIESPDRSRSQIVADTHYLLHQYWDCNHSVVFFKNKDQYILSFANKDQSHILSDWISVNEDYDAFAERINIGCMSMDTSDSYFNDFIYAAARSYYLYPISFENASWGMMPRNYIVSKLADDHCISKEDIKAVIRSNLVAYETLYGYDYVAPVYDGVNEQAGFQRLSAELERISFELELAADIDGDDQLAAFYEGHVVTDFESDDMTDDYEDDIMDELGDDVDPSIFSDPILMVKWLDQRQKIIDETPSTENDTNIHEMLKIEHRKSESQEGHQENTLFRIEQQERAKRHEQERLAAARQEQERLEQKRLAAVRRKQERLEQERLAAERLEQERLEQERLEQERLEQERLEQERLEAERLEQERLEAERLEQERLEQERLEAERLEAERLEQERLEQERLEAERLEAERLEAERLEAERCERERKRLEEEARRKAQYVSAKRLLQVNDSDPFALWLANKVSDEMLVDMYLAYEVIQEYATKYALIKEPLLKSKDTAVARTIQKAVKFKKEFVKLDGNMRYFCGHAMHYYVQYLSELEAARLEQKRIAEERRERERIAELRNKLAELEAEHSHVIMYLNDRYNTEHAQACAELSAVEKRLREIEIRIASLSFLQFIEKKTLKAEQAELLAKQTQLIDCCEELENSFEKQIAEINQQFEEQKIELGL